jgi:hypothetical protein
MRDLGVGRTAGAGHRHEAGADVRGRGDGVPPVAAGPDPGRDPDTAGEEPVGGVPTAQGCDRGDARSLQRYPDVAGSREGDRAGAGNRRARRRS